MKTENFLEYLINSETQSKLGDTQAEAPRIIRQHNSKVYEIAPALEIDLEAVVGGDPRMLKTKAIKKQKVAVQVLKNNNDQQIIDLRHSDEKTVSEEGEQAKLVVS